MPLKRFRRRDMKSCARWDGSVEEDLWMANILVDYIIYYIKLLEKHVHCHPGIIMSRNPLFMNLWNFLPWLAEPKKTVTN